ncbi:MAG: ChaN family lipoprotein [Polyangiales bacterium]
MRPQPLFLPLVLCVLAACHGPGRGPRHAEAARPTLLDARTFAEVDLHALAADCATVEVTYVGERHEVGADHAFEHELAEALFAERSSLAIGLEMFQRPAQPHLDDFVAGRIDEATMLERTDYEARWGHDYAGYRPVLELARANGLPLVALNARTEVSRAVARGGLDSLAPELRAEVPELDLGNAAHRAFVEEALRGHPGLTEEAIGRYYAAQVVWDETMGDTVATYVAQHPDRTLLVLAGAMHVAEGLGIPRTAARRGVNSRRIVVAMDADGLSAERARNAEPRSGDYLYVAPLE